MYEVWVSQGKGTRIGPRFRLLADALRHVHSRGLPGSYAIRYPDGRWHRWENGGSILRVRGAEPLARLCSRRRAVN